LVFLEELIVRVIIAELEFGWSLARINRMGGGNRELGIRVVPA
jgi:hypothetical protein